MKRIPPETSLILCRNFFVNITETTVMSLSSSHQTPLTKTAILPCNHYRTQFILIWQKLNLTNIVMVSQQSPGLFWLQWTFSGSTFSHSLLLVQMPDLSLLFHTLACWKHYEISRDWGFVAGRWWWKLESGREQFGIYLEELPKSRLTNWFWRSRWGNRNSRCEVPEQDFSLNKTCVSGYKNDIFHIKKRPYQE